MNETDGMTALTPQQMRELADEARRELTGVILAAENEYGFDPSHPEQALLDVSVAALRTAADQLEAVQAVLDRAEAENAAHLYPDEFTAILTADTAPQETHNGVPVFRDANGRARFGCSLEPITPDSAPHADECRYWGGFPKRVCTCNQTSERGNE